MGIGFGFKVVPGVRVRVSSRGVRTSVGPRVARVHVGGGRTTLSSGVGPVSVWTSGGRRRSSGGGSRRSSYGPTAAQLRQQAAAADRAQREADKYAAIQELVAGQRLLLSAHHETFIAASRPLLPTPDWVTPARFLQDAERRHLTGVGRFDRSGREQARAAARTDADAAANQANAGLNEQWRAAQADADRWWAQLVSNDQDTVLDNVNAAFADNESPAVALGVEGRALTVLMIQPPTEAFGDRKAKLTPAGNWTIGTMTKTEQRQQWTSCTLSRAVATIAEALSVAPAIDQIDLVVASQPVGTSRYQLVLAGSVQRAAFERVTWPAEVSVHDLFRAGTFTHRLDRFGALADVATDADPELRSLVQTLNNAIDTDDDLDSVHDIRTRQPQPSPQHLESAPHPIPIRVPTPRVDAHDPSPRNGAADHRPATKPAAGRAFMLWGSPVDWCNVDVVGTSYREADVVSLIPAVTRDGVERPATCQLVPDAGNPYDRNAVACWIEGRHVGYLSRTDAARYVGVLTDLVGRGDVPTTRARVWAAEVDTWNDAGERSSTGYRTSVRVALGEPGDLVPVNRLPAKPRVMLPSGWPLKVSNTKEFMETLIDVLGGRPECWVYGTMSPATVVTPRATKVQVRIAVDGRQIGTLSSQMTAAYLAMVEPLDRAGWKPMVQVHLQGNSVAAVAEVHVVRTHDLGQEWITGLERATKIHLRMPQ